MKKVVIAGGTGFIGSYLRKRFQLSGYRVLIISRESGYVSWNPVEIKNALEDAELVINLAGKSIHCRHNEVNQRAIVVSRVNATKSIGDAIKACVNPPRLWINASATGIYKPSLNHPMLEDELNLGTDFLSEVVREWEKIFFSYKFTETRQVALRTSVVLGRGGGALKPLITLIRFGLGGRQGNGKQMFSWIHEEDYFRSLLFLLENPSLNGIVNCTSPAPVSNNELMYTLRIKHHMEFGLPAPKLAVKLGALLFDMEPELILNSSFVMPKRLTDSGFQFHYPTLDLALIDLVRSYKT
jgi:uncharacterized protein (TIGR01777 family)